MKSFMEFLQLKEEDNQSAANHGKTANEVIADLLNFKVGDKLLFNNKPIQIENVVVDAVDANKKRIQKSFNSVKEAADFVDNNNFMEGTIEAYFGHTPIYLLNISRGMILRHQMADYLLQQIKPMPTDDAEDGRWERMESTQKKSMFDW